MTVTDVDKDPAHRTMTITARFDAKPDRVWQLWADPRQLERWWGPPTYPATIVDHNLSPGGRVTYFMTGPEGDKFFGWWQILSAEAPHQLEFEDGFADETGTPNPDLPTMVASVQISEHPESGSQMQIRSTFASIEAMDQLIAMGMEEGFQAALGQIDDLLVSIPG